MRTEYTIYKPGDGPAERGEIDWPKNPGYHAIKTLVVPLLGEEEPLEHVSVLFNGKHADMFVSELGHMTLTNRAPFPDRGPLPRNNRATNIYRTAWMAQHPDQDSESLPDIVGVAVLFHRRIWS